MLHVDVRKDDITAAIIALSEGATVTAFESATCPIAQALHRMGFTKAVVRYDHIRLNDKLTVVPLPDRAIRFNERWDRQAHESQRWIKDGWHSWRIQLAKDITVRPFSFDLDT